MTPTHDEPLADPDDAHVPAPVPFESLPDEDVRSVEGTIVGLVTRVDGSP